LDESEQILTLEPNDNRRLANLCGTHDENLRFIERALQIQIANRGNRFVLTGQPQTLVATVKLLQKLYHNLSVDDELTPTMLHLEVGELLSTQLEVQGDPPVGATTHTTTHPNETIQTKHKLIQPRGANQHHYVHHIRQYDLNFGVGPAGTGKTYLAVAAAVQALETGRVRRIILVRPAVEAGERLGFLPGDFAQKVDPYLRPLYDALFEIMGLERVGKLLERNIIEIAPLAYMRGRTLNDAFIILDESQNTTREQMKMFLTRLGFGSIAVVTGDLTQIDLPKGTGSGLVHALTVLADIKGINVTRFGSQDVVRHPLVQRIVDAYTLAETKTELKR